MTATDATRRTGPPGLRLLAPGDEGWDAGRATFNLLDDQRPALIALPRDAGDVAAAIAVARREGLSVAAQATGHGAACRHPLEGALLVNTDGMRDVDVDPDSARVRVGAGARWRDVAPQLSAVGLAGLHGSSLGVGLAGYSLGGGVGWLTRKHGLQCNAVRAIELVAIDGEHLRVDAEHHVELFWALRGGGGNFGVVTALEFDAVRVPRLAAGAFFFPVERTADVLRTWSALLPSLPEDLTTWVAVMHFPPLDGLPPEVRGRSYAIVMAAHLGSESEARRLLRPLQELRPIRDTLAATDPLTLGTLAMDPEDPLPYRSTTALVDRLPDDAIEELAALSGAGSALTMLQFRHIGGALARRPGGAGARATLPGEILVFSLAIPTRPDDRSSRALERLDGLLAPLKVGEYPNLVEHPVDASRFFDASTWKRLQAVKAAYDPADLVHGNHHVPAAAGG